MLAILAENLKLILLLFIIATIVGLSWFGKSVGSDDYTDAAFDPRHHSEIQAPAKRMSQCSHVSARVLDSSDPYSQRCDKRVAPFDADVTVKHTFVSLS